MKPSRHIQEFVAIDYDAEYESFLAKLSPLSTVLSDLTPATRAEPGDVKVLLTVMKCFTSCPVLSYKELYLENATTNKLVGGKIDLLVGSSSLW